MTDEAQRTRILSRALVVRYDGREHVVPPDFHGLFAIGRGSSCHIVIDSPVVSRLHGCIRVVDGEYIYRDTSSNGTVVMAGHDETLVHDAEIELAESGVLRIGEIHLPFVCRVD